MKGRRAIRFRQWLTLTVTDAFFAVMLVCYDYFTMKTPMVEKATPNFPWFDYFFLNLAGATIAGGLISAFMVYYLQDRFRDKSYGYSVLILLSIILAIMILATIPYYMIQATQTTGKPISDPETMRLYRSLFDKIDPGYFVLLPLMALQQIMLQVSNKFGPGVLWKIVKGTYNTPKIENRIFMFADLNDSTTIAEKLSDERYHKFLRNFFADITTPILDHSGEIYQYLGDGIIIVWHYYGNEKDLLPIDCFFEMKKEIESKTEKYEKKFGTVPNLKQVFIAVRWWWVK